MALKPNKWAPLRKMSEWDGRQVKTLRDITNKNGDVIPKGSVCKATGYPRGTVNLTWERIWITRVNNKDVELLQ